MFWNHSGKALRIPQIRLTWHDDLVAGDAFGGELVTVAVVAEQGLVLAGEGLICQRAIAAEAAETVLVIVAVLVEEFLAATQKQHAVIWKGALQLPEVFQLQRCVDAEHGTRG